MQPLSRATSAPLQNHCLALCFLGACLFLVSSARAQVNTEKLRVGADLAGFGGSFDLTFSLRSGNSDVLSLGAGFRFQHVHLVDSATTELKAVEEAIDKAIGLETSAPGATELEVTTLETTELALLPESALEKQVFFLVSNFSFSEENEERSVNTGFSHLRWGRNFNPHFGIEAFAQHQFNEFTNLDTRLLLGFGGRFTLLRRANRELFWGSSYMYEFERLDEPKAGTESRVLRHNRWNNYLTLRLNTKDDRLLFVNTLYVQPSLSGPEDLRVLNEAELQINFGKRVSFGLSASLAHDSEPPAGVKKTDISLVNKIRFVF